MPAPIVSATAQATALASCSNVLAQLIDHWRKGESVSFSFGDLIRFLVVTVLTAPPNFLWQAYLERTFPGRKSTEDHDIHLAERGHGREGSSRHSPPPSTSGLLDPVDDKEHTLRGADMRGLGWAGTRLDWRNTMTKWFVDCITVGALGNTVAFLLLMGLLKHKPLADIGDAIRSDTIPIIVAGYKIWPVASIISFSLIPVEKRIVFLSAVGLVWGVYMSLVAARQ